MNTKIGQAMKYSLLTILLMASVYIFTAKSTIIIPDDNVVYDSTKVIEPKNHYNFENQLITTILSRYHFKKFDLNDSLSKIIFDRYVNSLDPGKSYFLKSDINQFEIFQEKIDDLLLDGDLSFFYDVFNLYVKRVNEREKYIKILFENEFDFSTDEVFIFNRDSISWAEDLGELNDRWIKRIKNDAITYKLNEKDWEFISGTLQKRYSNYAKFLNQYNSEDVFQLAMNAFTQSIEPHTNYLSPVTSDNFKIDMSLSLEGIGARLQTEDDYTKVVEVIPGGPAAKSKLLNVDDKIIGVAQGDEGEFVDIIGWRITEAVKLIRGAKGTKVRLQIIPAKSEVNVRIKEISLVRDKVKIEDQAAQHKIIEIEENGNPRKIGIITIPSFYIDFDGQRKGERDYKSTTRDVKKILDTLMTEKVDGIIIDLRNNGGGSLSEAIELTGLFIEEGPVVQVKNSDGSIDIGDDPDPTIVYDGPLAVIVNRFSASASEIFSGAIQDYGRGLILGEQTFGKGTVQNLIDLNRLASGQRNELGQVKLTIAKYYRINGGSVQNLGVVPDIEFPSFIEANEFGESSEPNALPWDKIEPTEFSLYDNLSNILPVLLKNHNERMKDNIEYQQLIDEIREFRENRKRTTFSLNLSERMKENQEIENKKFERENELRKAKGLKLLEKGEAVSNDINEIDFLLRESANILGDLIARKAG
ncbi:MAG: carboxy terminal-processing peptidase [Ignavibacteriaceae bacterium]